MMLYKLVWWCLNIYLHKSYNVPNWMQISSVRCDFHLRYSSETGSYNKMKLVQWTLVKRKLKPIDWWKRTLPYCAEQVAPMQMLTCAVSLSKHLLGIGYRATEKLIYAPGLLRMDVAHNGSLSSTIHLCSVINNYRICYTWMSILEFVKHEWVNLGMFI